MTVTDVLNTYPTFNVEGLMGETAVVAVKTEQEAVSFGTGAGADPDFDLGLIVDEEADTVTPFWFERGYWEKPP